MSISAIKIGDNVYLLKSMYILYPLLFLSLNFIKYLKIQYKLIKHNLPFSSCSLGLRLGGMQVYQLNLGRYLCRSKNYGRNLSVEGLKMALR